MSSTESIAKIYEILEKHFGKSEARKATADCIALAISRLQDDNMPITEENMSKILTEFSDDYAFASKRDVA